MFVFPYFISQTSESNDQPNNEDAEVGSPESTTDAG
jgi:hypothetical protein